MKVIPILKMDFDSTDTMQWSLPHMLQQINTSDANLESGSYIKDNVSLVSQVKCWFQGAGHPRVMDTRIYKLTPIILLNLEVRFTHIHSFLQAAELVSSLSQLLIIVLSCQLVHLMLFITIQWRNGYHIDWYVYFLIRWQNRLINVHKN